MFKQELRRHLENAFPPQDLARWFDPLRLERDGAHLRISFPHRFFRDWFMRELRPEFERQTAVLADDLSIVYDEGGAARTQQTQVFRRSGSRVHQEEGAGRGGATRRERMGDGLRQPLCTFDTFLCNRKNDFPLKSARQLAGDIAAGRPASFCPFVVYGHICSGKSHLLEAVAEEVRGSGRRVYSGTAVYLQRPRLASGTYTRVDEDCVCIDEAQQAAANPAMQKTLTSLIDACQAEGKLLVLAFDVHPGVCDGLKDKLRSRLTSGLVVELKRPDLDIRRQYVARACADAGLRLTKNEMLVIVQRCQDIRAINGAIARLAAFRSVMDKEEDGDSYVSLVLNKDGSGGGLSPTTVIALVCKSLSVNPTDVIGSHRGKRENLARHISMYLCRELIGLSLVQTGRFFSGRDHSSVLYAVRKIKQLRQSDKDVHTLVDDVRKKCLNLF